MGLQGNLEDGRNGTLASLFPDYPQRVFAHWYTGTLCIPQGPAIRHDHGGYGATFERYLCLAVTRGVVTSTWIHHPPKTETPQQAQQ